MNTEQDTTSAALADNRSNYTPGKWHVLSAGLDRLDIVTLDKDGSPNGRIASIKRVAWCNEGEEYANARLIAAAPEMLAALEVIAGMKFDFDHSAQHRQKALQLVALAVIAKAKGVL